MNTLHENAKRIVFSPSDIHHIHHLSTTTAPLQAEQFDGDEYLDRIIEKPWGHEYRIYADQLYDLWKLFIAPRQQTSMHCHPRKETALLCLAGQGTVQFLGHTHHQMQAHDCIFIGKGVFHSTTNTGDIPLELVEVEVPRNKLDLVRLADTYGRSGTPYETESLDANTSSMLKHDQLVPGSKMRTTCLANSFRFEIRAGSDIPSCPVDQIFFLVPLSVLNAITHHLEVFMAPNDLSSEHSREERYFVISKNTTEETNHHQKGQTECLAQ